MAYLDTYTVPLTAKTAAHLLRRATFGPTMSEISAFQGKTAAQAVESLISNAQFHTSPPPPVELADGRSDSGQPFMSYPFDPNRDSLYYSYILYWWIGLMADQSRPPSLLEKLTAFWQNHFVTAYVTVDDYRLMYRYLTLLRSGAMGNFRDLVKGITKDAAMLIYQDGYKNEKSKPNENYARELQELFTVGQKDFAGNHNYTEEDVKSAARVLTGWGVTNYKAANSTSFDTVFNPDRHDTTDKTFSSYYGNRVITGRSGTGAGDAEVADLVEMLLHHPQSPRFICRKLYRWYVDPEVTQEIEDQVISPLADFFSSASNNFEILPVVRKLLTSQIFFDNRNIGAIVKSPAELMIGSVRLFEQPVPDIKTEYASFRTMMNYLSMSMKLLDLNFLNQPSVFGFPPYYQTGYSRNWINGTTLGQRGSRTDTLVYSGLTIKPGYVLGMDILGRLQSIQPNFSDVAASPAITCDQVLGELSRNLYAVDLSQAQQDFLIDKIMMMNSSPRTSWTNEWNAYRTSPTDATRQNTILWRCRALMKYMMRMAEYQLF